MAGTASSVDVWGGRGDEEERKRQEEREAAVRQRRQMVGGCAILTIAICLSLFFFGALLNFFLLPQRVPPMPAPTANSAAQGDTACCCERPLAYTEFECLPEPVPSQQLVLLSYSCCDVDADGVCTPGGPDTAYSTHRSVLTLDLTMEEPPVIL